MFKVSAASVDASAQTPAKAGDRLLDRILWQFVSYFQ